MSPRLATEAPRRGVFAVAVSIQAVLLAVLVRLIMLLAIFVDPVFAFAGATLRIAGVAGLRGVAIDVIVAGSVLQTLAVAFPCPTAVFALGVRLRAASIVLSIRHHDLLRSRESGNRRAR